MKDNVCEKIGMTVVVTVLVVLLLLVLWIWSRPEREARPARSARTFAGWDLTTRSPWTGSTIRRCRVSPATSVGR